MKKIMKKVTALVLPAVLTVTFATATLTELPSAQAATTKQQIQLSGNATYYGELLNGKPHGVGTISWGDKKQYSGHFINGKRSGSGKYIAQYVVKDGRTHKVVYNGSWTGDMMNGKGTYTEKTYEKDGTLIMNEIRVGTFKDNQFVSGYRAQNAVADPEYAFTYKNNGETLYVMGNNKDMVKAWKNGEQFFIAYQKGAISKKYWVIPEDTAAQERARLNSLKYLKKITAQVTPHLKEFERLSKLIPLK